MADRPEDYEVRNPAPNGCAVCGSDRRNHPQQWHPATGYHIWQEPSDAQRLARMWDRRRAREQAAKIADVRRRYWMLLDGKPEQHGVPSKRTGKPGLYSPKVTGSKRATLEILSVRRQLEAASAARMEHDSGPIGFALTSARPGEPIHVILCESGDVHA